MNTTVRITLREPFEDLQIEVDIEVDIDADGYDIANIDADGAFDAMIAAGDAVEVRPGLWTDANNLNEYDDISEVPVKGRRFIVDMIFDLANEAEIDWEELQSRYEDDREEDYDDTENL